jgi:hypothetical protein
VCMVWHVFHSVSLRSGIGPTDVSCIISSEMAFARWSNVTTIEYIVSHVGVTYMPHMIDIN